MPEFKYFTLKPQKPNQLLTSFEAPQVAQASKSFQPKPTKPSPTYSGSYSSYNQNFIGPGGNPALGQGTNVNNQTCFASKSPSKSQDKPFDNAAALAGLQKQAAEQNALYESQQATGDMAIAGDT